MVESELKINLRNGDRVVSYLNYGVPRTEHDNVLDQKGGRFMPRHALDFRNHHAHHGGSGWEKIDP